MPNMVMYESVDNGVRLVEEYERLRIGKVKFSKKKQEETLKDVMDDINNITGKCSEDGGAR